jgi:hypothetical protein
MSHGDAEAAMAGEFDKVVRRMYPDGHVAASVVAGGCATLMVNYFSRLEPTRRTLILNDMVELMIEGFHDHGDSDLHYLN